MYLATVACDSSNPSFNSSPWIRGAPQRGLAKLILRIRAAQRMAAFPFPVQSESLPVPSDHGLRLDDKQRRSPTSPKPREPNPQNAVSGSEIKAMSLLGALENQELLS